MISDVADLPADAGSPGGGAGVALARSSRVIAAQKLAVGAAEVLGRDVDRPTGLQKVTLTS